VLAKLKKMDISYLSDLGMLGCKISLEFPAVMGCPSNKSKLSLTSLYTSKFHINFIC